MQKMNKKTILVSSGLVLLGVFLGVVQPFIRLGDSGEARTIAVQGEATIKAEPDEFVFYPYFQATSKTRAGAINSVTTIGDNAVANLKKLGVLDKELKTDISANEDYSCYNCEKPTGYMGMYNITITIADKDLADKVQNYLIKSKAEGGLTPSASFSDVALEQLKSDARAKAVENAKERASQIATELEVKLGKVMSIEEVSGFDDGIFYASRESAVALDTAVSSGASSEVYAGEQEVTFTVKATFEAK